VGGWSAPHPIRFTPRKYPVPIVWEAGLAPGFVWMGTENLTCTGILSPDRPVRSESLYRLSYLSPRNGWYWVVTLFRVMCGVGGSERHLQGRSATDCSKILCTSPRLHGLKIQRGTSALTIRDNVQLRNFGVIVPGCMVL
jgi:hypothetical protein